MTMMFGCLDVDTKYDDRFYYYFYKIAVILSYVETTQGKSTSLPKTTA